MPSHCEKHITPAPVAQHVILSIVTLIHPILLAKSPQIASEVLGLVLGGNSRHLVILSIVCLWEWRAGPRADQYATERFAAFGMPRRSYHSIASHRELRSRERDRAPIGSIAAHILRH